MDQVTMSENRFAAGEVARAGRRDVGLVIGSLGLILALATAAGAATGVIFDRWTGVDGPRAYAAGELQALTTVRLSCVLFAFQLVAVIGAFGVARRFRQRGFELLPVARSRPRVLSLIGAVVGLFVISGGYGLAVYQVDRTAMAQDLGPFVDMIRTDAWWLILLAAGIGAPCAEEFLFRGLLYGILRTSPTGKIGAGFATAAAWSAMHANYAIYGLGAIFFIGLYFAWLRERTGSLIAPMLCHSVYNSLIVLAIRASPDIVPIPG